MRIAMAQIRVMMATWFQGTINEFIEPNKKATNAFRALHFLGGMSIEIKGKRAISQVKAAMSQRDHLLEKRSPLALWGLRCCRQSRRAPCSRPLSRRSFWMVATWLLFVANSQIVSAQDRAAISLDPIAWTPIGPAPSRNGRTTFLEDTSGRITAIVAHPTDPNVIYIGAAGGGVWKTIDGGSTWTPLTDGQSTLFIGAIALALSNPNVIYAGTGEANMGPSKVLEKRANIYYGRGILKSADGGDTWTLLGASQFDRRTISRIVVDPTDPDIVYVAVGAQAVNGLPGSTGIWKSSDGGATWTNTTEGSISTAAAFSDLAMSPSDRMRLYAAVGEPGGSASNGVYNTSDGGMSWSPAGDFPIGIANGRISVAAAPSAPETLYAAVAGSGNGSLLGRLYRFMKTTDGGATWRRSHPPTDLCQGDTQRTNYLARAGDYHNTLAVDPANANVVYGGGLCVVVSTDGGASWSSIGEGTRRGPHRDHHALAFDARNPPRLLDGNDGGIWRLLDRSGPTSTWDNLNTNLQITQFVGIALHPTNPNTAYGGTQDTGVMKFGGDVRWVRQLRGDGGAFAVNPLHPKRVYAISRSGCSDGKYFKRSNNGGGKWVTKVPRIDQFSTDPCDPPLNFYPPFVLEPTNATPAQDRLLLGTNRVFQTVNGAEEWNPISTPGTAGWTGSDRDLVDSIAAAPSDVNTIYASAGGHIFVTFDRGANWHQRDIPTVSDHFAALVVDPTNNLIAYAVRDRFTGGHVFRTTDGGHNWIDISGDLPDIPTQTIVLDPRVTPNIIYLGTDRGVFSSMDLGLHWSVFGTGFPNAQVVELKLNPNLNILAAGTHGRGVWEILAESGPSAVRH
jgi:photosystem II stability/assembly factor-like uncharacterized protein